MDKSLEAKIQGCKSCKEITEITYKKPKSFYGSKKPKIMLVGHSPAVRTLERAEVVLKMDKKNRPLYKYITKEILDPLSIDIKNIYCTNLIKCCTAVMPEDIPNSKKFFQNTFKNCRQLFEAEVKEIDPKIIISLSERVLTLLSENYCPPVLKMQEVFGKLLSLKINNKNYPYIPVVHIPKGKESKVGKKYFPLQTERLKSIKL